MTDLQVGTVLRTDEAQIQSEKRRLQSFLPLVQKVLKSVEDLQLLPKITNAIWQKLIETKGRSIRDDYTKRAMESVKEQVNFLNEDDYQQKIRQRLQGFNSAYREISLTMGRLRTSSVLTRIDLSKDIKIVDGEPQIFMERLEEIYTRRIKDDNEIQLIAAIQKVEESLNGLNQLINFDLTAIGRDLNRFFEIDRKNKTLSFKTRSYL